MSTDRDIPDDLWASGYGSEPEEVLRTGIYFEGKTFIPSRLANGLRRNYPTATGGRQLYIFKDGIYRPSEDFLRREITTRLGSKWRNSRADETIAHLLQGSDALWETPPLDRIAVRNGILHLADRSLTEPTAKHLSPVQIGAAYSPKARCPKIDEFLRQALPNEDDVALLLELFGYLMIPDNTQQKAVMLVGPGGNGKSTALNLLIAFLGGLTNVSSVPLQKLDDNRFASADLYGVLANVCADLDASVMQSTSEFKKIVGGDPIHAERKNRDPFTFIPYARLLFSTNEPPPTHDVSQAFFDRWIILPFMQRFRDTASEDRHLIDKLSTPRELSGLLNRALDGLERLRRKGSFTSSETTRRAAVEFRISVDSAAGYLAQCAEFDPKGRTRLADLFSGYRDWCAENNRRPLGAQRFHSRVREIASASPALQEDGLDEVTVQGRPTYLGVRRKDEP